MVQEFDVIIVGGGVCGLLAAKDLSERGLNIALLEAKDRFGGRVFTLNTSASPVPLELGAEFVHGELPATVSVLKEAGLEYMAAFGETWTAVDGRLQKSDSLHTSWSLFEEKLRDLREDMSLKVFLDQYFAGSQFETLRIAVERFAAGYDTAEIDRVSSFALRDEWLGDFNGSKDYRIRGGYGALISWLLDFLNDRERVELFLSSVVKQVSWKPGRVEVTTENGRLFTARRLLVTVPLGVLQAGEGVRGGISFTPAISRISEAVGVLGFGSVIKIVLLFKEPFWEKDRPEIEKMEFILADTSIPVWWTQFPDKGPVLTGWLGGAAASAFISVSKDVLREEALKSLVTIFDIPSSELKNQLVEVYIVNWSADPFTRGSYSYATIGYESARDVLNRPIENTIFFAGEALSKGPVMGTVEAALGSALEVAKKIAASIERS